MTYCPSSLRTPAPCDYDVHSSTLTGTGITLSGRIPGKEPFRTPAGGAYTPDESYTTKHKRQPAYSIGRKTGSIGSSAAVSPGPVYLPSIDYTTRKSQATAVIQERHPERIGNRNPAPNMYNTRPDIKKETPQLSLSGRFEEKLPESPGVGSYNVRSRLDEHGCKISHRYASRSASNPGPGDYDIARYSAFQRHSGRGCSFHSRLSEKQGMYIQ